MLEQVRPKLADDYEVPCVECHGAYSYWKHMRNIDHDASCKGKAYCLTRICRECGHTWEGLEPIED